MLLGLCGSNVFLFDYSSKLIGDKGFTRLHIIPAGGASDDATSCVAIKRETQSVLREHLFQSAASLLDYVTKRWQQQWVTTDIQDQTEQTLQDFFKRPFFLLVSIDAPVMVRWKRLGTRCKQGGKASPTLEQFISHNDTLMYHPRRGLAGLLDRAELRLLNNTVSMKHLHEVLDQSDIISSERVRPSWDQYFMQLASLAARRMISTGYNGTPRNLRNCNEGGCERCNSGASIGMSLSTCLCIHAEENALLEAGRERIREGSILYCDTCPCLTCSIKITQVGIAEVVYSQKYGMDLEAAAVFQEGGVELRQYSAPAKGLIWPA